LSPKPFVVRIVVVVVEELNECSSVAKPVVVKQTKVSIVVEFVAIETIVVVVVVMEVLPTFEDNLR
jgi:hypothetical protein